MSERIASNRNLRLPSTYVSHIFNQVIRWIKRRWRQTSSAGYDTPQLFRVVYDVPIVFGCGCVQTSMFWVSCKHSFVFHRVERAVWMLNGVCPYTSNAHTHTPNETVSIYGLAIVAYFSDKFQYFRQFPLSRGRNMYLLESILSKYVYLISSLKTAQARGSQANGWPSMLSSNAKCSGKALVVWPRENTKRDE